MPEIRNHSNIPKIASEVHELASLLGVLGLRWFVIRQSLSVQDVMATETAAMDETLNQLREAYHRLSDLMKPALHDSGTPVRASRDDEGLGEYE
ncbi:MAG: hypothetical protein Q8K78_13575 [Planctomycetaceae bacterium]|nr:hypothetical protein [Planctomycetaceae bacterium]